MSQNKMVKNDLVVIFNVSNKKVIHTGINAEMLKDLFCVKNEWLTSVKLKQEKLQFNNTEAIFIDVLPESNLGLN